MSRKRPRDGYVGAVLVEPCELDEPARRALSDALGHEAPAQLLEALAFAIGWYRAASAEKAPTPGQQRAALDRIAKLAGPATRGNREARAKLRSTLLQTDADTRTLLAGELAISTKRAAALWELEASLPDDPDELLGTLPSACESAMQRLAKGGRPSGVELWIFADQVKRILVDHDVNPAAWVGSPLVRCVRVCFDAAGEAKSESRILGYLRKNPRVSLS